MATAIKSDDEVKCNDCEGYLSFSPVFVKESGKSVCGNCNEKIKDQTYRNLTYEAIAKSNSFPCRFKSSGCQEKHVWEAAKQHEEECVYRKYNCFVPDCQWIGNNFNIHQHYKENHSKFLLQLPCVLQPNINVDTDAKYLAFSLDTLFIVHVKYSVTTSMLSYYTCLLGKTDLAKFFNYNLEISSKQGNVNIVNMTKVVQPITELHSPQKGDIIEFNLNGLLSFGLITKYEDCKINLLVKLINNLCVKCSKELTVKKAVENDCYCDNCYKPLVNEVKIKCVHCKELFNSDILNKHQKWMCLKNYNDCECGCAFSYYMKHIVDMHVFTANRFNTNTFTVKNVDIISESTKFAVSTVFNATFLVFLKFTAVSKTFEFKIISNLMKDEIKCFTCHFKLSNPKTGYATPVIPMTVNFAEDYDWIATVKNDIKKSFISSEYVAQSYRTVYNVTISIEKNF